MDVQQAIQQRVESSIGSLVIQNIDLSVKLDALSQQLKASQAKIEELEAKLPKSD